MLSRRQLIASAFAASLAATAPALAQSTPVTIALDWTPNTNHIGLYVAQAKGFYAQAGLEVQIVPYSANSDVIAERPDFSSYYTNAYLAAGQ